MNLSFFDMKKIYVPRPGETIDFSRLAASTDYVRSQYRSLALRHHPDRGGSAEQMREVNREYLQIKNILK